MHGKKCQGHGRVSNEDARQGEERVVMRDDDGEQERKLHGEWKVHGMKEVRET